jgi:translation elongation factor EF-G
MDWMAQEQERGITIYICYNLFLEFSMRQGEALPLPYHFNIDTQDTLILL